MNEPLIHASLDQVVLALAADDPVIGALHATVAQTLATLAAADTTATPAPGVGPGRPSRSPGPGTVSETFNAWKNDIDWLNTVATQSPPETPEVERPEPTPVMSPEPPGRLRRPL